MKNLKQKQELISQIENQKTGESTKDLGQVFTPNYIVDIVLDEIGYKGDTILTKKIIEPSFGDGAFLIKIAQRLIEVCNLNNLSNQETMRILEENIYGIEIDPELYSKTIEKLNYLLSIYSIDNIEWKNLYNENTIFFKTRARFDFVAGNPPYVRIHNIDEETRNELKNYKFSDGCTDLYIMFFEKCLNILKKDGKLGFITPNSYMTNTSQKSFRKYLMKENLIKNIIDFKSEKVFENISTYTAITILDKAKKDYDFTYKVYSKKETKFVSNYSILDFNEQTSSEPWNFDTEENNNLLNLIRNRSLTLEKYATIQYGVATNKDGIYIGKKSKIGRLKRKVSFTNGLDKDKTFEIEASILRPVVKGSKFKGIVDEDTVIIFPYTWNSNKKVYEVIPENVLKEKYPLAYDYFLYYEVELVKRDIKGATKWYEYGRSQGLNNTHHKKLVIKNIYSLEQDKIEVYEVDSETVVYSGIYITCQNETHLEKVKEILESEEFYTYAKIVGKNMSGGYKNISSTNIKKYGISQFKGTELFEFPEEFNNLNDDRKDEYWEKYFKNVFLSKIEESYLSYLDNARSVNKIIPIHSFISEAVQFLLGDSYIVKSHGYDLSNEKSYNEIKVKGKYYSKDVDIAVMKNGNVLGAIGLKFICSNYLQNANNYFEGMLGETANLRLENNIYSQLIILPEYVPYFYNNKVCSKIEEIKDAHIEKYIKLMEDRKTFYHRPDTLSLVLIDTGNKRFLNEMKENKIPLNTSSNEYKDSVNITYSDLYNNEAIEKERTKQFLEKHFNIHKFIKSFVYMILGDEYNF
ncbi:hypothetical protein CRV08_04640 [Halarcobacter ebronensis]|uniref:site-specific DNA-methyltransferase (adenine-specific) n=1 Tax=Halarcobacter ebronensis TaxID=1462615 RepID=A0A4Q0YJW4_9BACT|nr:N-6 DNA methylase [Halarcobacter ebronensis]RXJ69301.1 hypothetical protein CRV08_04640 [Halarcobacter ebronensis]